MIWEIQQKLKIALLLSKTNSTGGNGGHGMGGGHGGGYNSPGGGGSGYHDGSVTVVNTRLGGGTGDAKIIIRIQT